MHLEYHTICLESLLEMEKEMNKLAKKRWKMVPGSFMYCRSTFCVVMEREAKENESAQEIMANLR